MVFNATFNNISVISWWFLFEKKKYCRQILYEKKKIELEDATKK
jgi:hypothetical protein